MPGPRVRIGEEAVLVEEREELVTTENNNIPRVVNSPFQFTRHSPTVSAYAMVFTPQNWKQVLRADSCMPG